MTSRVATVVDSGVSTGPALLDLHVIRKDTGAPLEHARVRIAGSVRDSGFTDSRGVATFSGLPTGRFSVWIGRIGFASGRDTVDVLTNRRTVVTASLGIVPNDACGSIGVVVRRKPWWKIW